LKIGAYLKRKKEDRVFSQNIKRIIGFSPKNIKLYRIALTHKTQHNPSKPFKFIKEDNERLEFLGDAVLDVIVADIVFNKFPLKNEGFLTEMRSKIVSRKQLNALAKKMALHQLIFMDEFHRNQQYEFIGGNALEALIGAIYIDKGFKKAKTFITKKLIAQYLHLEEIAKEEISFKGKLFEYAQKNKRELKIHLNNTFKFDKQKYFEIQVIIDDEILASATHPSKKIAEEQASEKAIKLIYT
jgi:ribonuclease-3